MPKPSGFAEDQKPFDAASTVPTPVGPVRLKIGEAGRIVIPADMREAMMVGPGDMVTARVVDGELRIISPRAAIRKAQKLVREYIAPGQNLVDELIADRREDARREAEDADAWRKAHDMPPLA